MNGKKAILAQLLLDSKKINGKTLFAKMTCYLELEKGIKTGFSFNPNEKYGHYDREFDAELKKLVAEGLIRVEHEDPNRPNMEFYYPTEKLMQEKINLDELTKKKSMSIVTEYSGFSPREIKTYDHAVHRDKKQIRVEKKIKEENLKHEKEYLRKSKNNMEEAAHLWFNDLKDQVKTLKDEGKY